MMDLLLIIHLRWPFMDAEWVAAYIGQIWHRSLPVAAIYCWWNLLWVVFVGFCNWLYFASSPRMHNSVFSLWEIWRNFILMAGKRRWTDCILSYGQYFRAFMIYVTSLLRSALDWKIYGLSIFPPIIMFDTLYSTMEEVELGPSNNIHLTWLLDDHDFNIYSLTLPHLRMNYLKHCDKFLWYMMKNTWFMIYCVSKTKLIVKGAPIICLHVSAS